MSAVHCWLVVSRPLRRNDRTGTRPCWIKDRKQTLLRAQRSLIYDQSMCHLVNQVSHVVNKGSHFDVTSATGKIERICLCFHMSTAPPLH